MPEKEVVLFLVKKFLSPARPHKSNVYENIFFISIKPTQTKKFPLANLLERIYVFSLQKIKDGALCFSTKKSTVRVVFKYKRYLKNSVKLIKSFFCVRPGEDLFHHPHFRKQEYYFFLALVKHFSSL